MKLKRRAEDFQVQEEISLAPSQGAWALYCLTKQSLGTLEAVAAIRRHWKLPRDAIAFAGLKDKHAITTQYVTVQQGPRRGLKESSFALNYLGQVNRPIHASDIRANRFVVVARNLDTDSAKQALAAARQAAKEGLPNYFDDQRFGSLGHSGEFIARPWCLGDYERALWLALAEPNSHDGRPEKDQKDFLRDHWGDWSLCQRELSRTSWSGVLSFLAAHPGDYRRAIAQTPHELRSLWLAAYQSHLWNHVLAGLLADRCPAPNLVEQSVGRKSVPFFTTLDSALSRELASTCLPLPSARLHLVGDPIDLFYERTLAAEGLAMRQLRVKYPRDTFFSKGERAALFQPDGLSGEVEDDELYAGRKKITLRFALSRGSYATIVLKRVSAGMNILLPLDTEI